MSRVNEYGWAAVAAGAALATEVALRALPLPLVCRLFGIEPPAPGAASDPVGLVEIQRGASLPSLLEVRRTAVRRAYLRLPLKDTCLRRALTLGQLLRGERPRLVIGVRRSALGIEAHAWLSVSGHVVEPGAPATGFSPYVSLQRN